MKLYMHDPELIENIIVQILDAIGRIERRAAGITNANDFLSNDEGIDRLDAICMMLIAIGESCKHLDTITGGDLLSQYPSIDWKGVKGIRDILSHQYFDIDADVVFSVCKKHVPQLKLTFESMVHDWSKHNTNG